MDNSTAGHCAVLRAPAPSSSQPAISRHQQGQTRQEVLHLLLTLTQRFALKPPIHCHLESDATHRGDKRELRKSGKHQASLESTLVSVRRLKSQRCVVPLPGERCVTVFLDNTRASCQLCFWQHQSLYLTFLFTRIGANSTTKKLF